MARLAARITLYEVTDETTVDPEPFLEAARARDKEAKSRKTEDEERALLAALREKYGDAPT